MTGVKLPLVPSKQFELTRAQARYELDEAPVVVVRQATRGATEQIEELVTQPIKRLFENGIIAVEERDGWRPLAYERAQVRACLIDCNLVGQDDKPLFRFQNNRLDMTIAEFNRSWGELPADIADEIIQCVYEMNPQWLMVPIDPKEPEGES